ncbi:redox-sensitive transcriptional activator SoxR [Flavobacterium sp. W21_SRS_FM6]|uniref:redox-sensitive transcriptional activator SoxR n=1 Tax=Flavobacterium sp. W21_SRS_FM6 TaxID=3240268 RepID=UPI003F8EB04B
MLPEQALTIGEVAKRCGIKVSTLHFYETKGLINSTRNLGNQRRYAREVLRRVALIKAAQKMGVSLEEIKQALATLPNNRAPNHEDWSLLAQNWQQQLDNRILYLQGLRDYLTGCIGCGCLSMKVCPLYNAEDALAKEGSGAVLLNKRVGE